MELKKALEKLEESSEFLSWRKENKDNYFSYAFCEFSSSEEGIWQIGYYDKKSEKVTTFIVNDKIEIMPQQEVFKKPGMDVEKVDLSKVKLSFAEIIDFVDKFQKEKYPNEISDKTITILQNLDEYGNVWNITLITESFKTLNIKVNPEDGKIIDYKLSSIIELRKQ